VSVWPFYLVVPLIGLGRAFSGPASQSLLPQVVSREQFPAAVAWRSSTFQIATIAGPALGGAIYLLGPVAAYGLCLPLFLLASLGVAVLHRRRDRLLDSDRAGETGKLAEGIAFVRSHPLILGSISLDLFAVTPG